MVFGGFDRVREMGMGARGKRERGGNVQEGGV